MVEEREHGIPEDPLTIPNIYKLFEEDSIDTISFLGECIGTMQRLKQSGTDSLKQWARFFIDVYEAEIEQEEKEIERFRATAIELEGIRRGRQSCHFP